MHLVVSLRNIKSIFDPPLSILVDLVRLLLQYKSLHGSSDIEFVDRFVTPNLQDFHSERIPVTNAMSPKEWKILLGFIFALLLLIGIRFSNRTDLSMEPLKDKTQNGFSECGHQGCCEHG